MRILKTYQLSRDILMHLPSNIRIFFLKDELCLKNKILMGREMSLASNTFMSFKKYQIS